MPKLLDKLDLPRLDGAACRDTDPELWFEASDGTPNPQKLAVLRSICGSCPAQQRCLEYALQRDMPGVWGGWTQAERAALLPASPLVCRECGTAFVRPGGHTGATQYCSEGCRREARLRQMYASKRRQKPTVKATA